MGLVINLLIAAPPGFAGPGCDGLGRLGGAKAAIWRPGGQAPGQAGGQPSRRADGFAGQDRQGLGHRSLAAARAPYVQGQIIARALPSPPRPALPCPANFSSRVNDQAHMEDFRGPT